MSTHTVAITLARRPTLFALRHVFEQPVLIGLGWLACALWLLVLPLEFVLG